jgi:hypothetical protein
MGDVGTINLKTTKTLGLAVPVHKLGHLLGLGRQSWPAR